MASDTPKNAMDLLAHLKDIIQEQELTISRQAERLKQLEHVNSVLKKGRKPSDEESLSQEPQSDEQPKTECTTHGIEERRQERTESLSSLPRRSSSFHRKHLEEQDARTRTDSYELSSDLFDRQIEVLRNKYGGSENCERAARIIQEAYRRYRMRLNFRKIRKSKTRRLTVENKIHINEENNDQHPEVEVVEFVLEQSFEKDDTTQEEQIYDEDQTPDATANDNQEEKFDKLFDTSATRKEPSPLVDTSKNPEENDIWNKTDEAESRELMEIAFPGIVLGFDSVRRRRKKRHGYETVVLPGKDKEGEKAREKDDDSGTLKRGEELGDASSLQSQSSDRDGDSSAQWKEWPRVGSSTSLASNENDEESLRSSDTASIASGQSEFSNNISGEGYQRRSTLSTRGSFHIDSKNDVLRKRLYRIGLNLFNKKPEKGIEFLVEHNFIARTAPAVATFLLNRKGMSKQMVGEYLGNTQKRFNQETLDAVCELMDFSGMEIDEALRNFQHQVKVQGEAQKVDRLVEAFSQRYCMCNPKFVESLQNPDAIFILAFAIIMLNTDLHSPNMKREKRMSEEDFVKNLRGIDAGDDLDKAMLHSVYARIRDEELKTGDDHVTQVLNVEKNIIGKKPVLAVPHRRLVCYCRLYQVLDPAKSQKIGLHQRAVFLFNDLLLITKVVQRKKSNTTYSYKLSLPLQGMSVLVFETTYYLFGVRLINSMDNKVLVTFNAPNEQDRKKFVNDLRESVNEVQQMENYRIGVELERAQLPADGRGSLTRDTKALSTSMYNLNEMKGSHDSAPPPFIGMDRPASMYDLQQDTPNRNNNNLKTSDLGILSSPVTILDTSNNSHARRSNHSFLSAFKVGKKGSDSPSSQSAGFVKDKLRSNGKPRITLGFSNI